MPELTPEVGLNTSTALPEDIAEPLYRVAKRHRRLKITGALLKAVLISLVISLTGALIMGGSPMMPLALRWIIAMAAWTAIVFATIRLLRPAISEVNLQVTARLVETREPEHEERILSAVEFAQSPPAREHASPEMVRHVIMQAQEHTGRINMATVISTNNIMRWTAYCVPAVLAWLILWPLFPQTVTTGVRRIFAPWSAPMGSGLAVRVTPGDVTLGQGSTLEIMGKIKPVPGDKPIRSMALTVTNPAGVQRLIPMTRIGPEQFRADLRDVETSLQYQIHVRNTTSPRYHVRVIARPRIAGLQLHYTYPAYTAMAPRSVVGKNGSIKAIIGTQVQLIVRASQKLSARSILAMHTPIAGVLQPLPLTHLAGLEYQATFPVQYSTTYRIDLVNTGGIDNNDNQRWPIIALTDPLPVIHVLTPARRVRVRVDDTIPITFQASDKFGLSGVRAIVRVDHSAPITVDIDLGIKNPRNVEQQWNLSVADQILSSDQPHAQAIFYRLEAIDNCEPAHQKSRTGLHELVIDRRLQQSYQQRQNMRAYNTLKKALAKARQNIGRDQQRLGNLERAPANRRLTAFQRRGADQVQQNLAQTVDNLKAAANAAKNTAFAHQGTKALATAEKNLPKAANRVAAATFAGPQQPQLRRQNLAEAQQNLQQAQNQLNDLQQQMAQQAGQQELADNLNTLAKRQENLAQKMLEHPHSPAVARQQQQIHRQLTTLLQAHKALQTPVAAKVLPTMANLKTQLGKIVTAQQSAADTIQKRLQANSARQQLSQLAVQQQKLNQRIRRFENAAKSDLRAPTPLPAPAVMNAVVSNLRQQAAGAALEGQHQISNRLDQAANEFNQAAQPPSSQQRQALQAAEQHERQLSNITQAGNTLGMLTARQELSAIERSAQALNQLAQKMLNDAPTPVEAAELNSAMRQAQAAMRAAADQNINQAGAALQRAGNLINQAVQRQVAATHAQMATPGQLRQLGARATALAQRQEQLASQTQRLLAQSTVPPGNIIQQSQIAQHIATQITHAATLAKQLERQTQSGAPDLTSDLAQARRQMQAGVRAQQASAQAIQGSNNAAAQEHQQTALQHIRIAMDDLNGALHSPEMRDVPQYKDMIAGQIQPKTAKQEKSAGGQAGPGTPQHVPAGQTSYQRIMAAAQQVQHAMQAVQQAGQGDSQAAQQAAQSLGAAGQTINSQASSGPAGMPGSGTGTSVAAGPGVGQAGAVGAAASATGAGISGNPKGLNGSGGPVGAAPKPVLALGISPAQWRNLGPLTKRQLLNTARQNIPSGYKRMVRDYYIRLSEMRSQ